MRKTLVIVAIAIILMMAIGKLQQYTIDGVVVEDKGSTIIVEDKTGHLWEVEVEAFTFREGDRVTLTMKDKGTTSRLDDEAINIQPIEK